MPNFEEVTRSFPPLISLSREDLQALTPHELMEAALLAIRIHEMAMENLRSFLGLLDEKDTQISLLTSQNETLTARITTLEASR